MRITAPILLAFAGLLTGCSLIPSGWRIGGSPLDKREKAEKKAVQAADDALGAAQAAIHKAGIALESAPTNDRPVAVAKDFVAEAQAIIDQVKGGSPAAEVAQWRSLVAGLLSENAAIRSAAEKQRIADAHKTADLSDRLAAATAAAARANSRALEYAKQSEELADFARKLKLGFFALIGLLGLGSILSIAARFVPQLGLAAKIVNGVVAPGVTYVASRAEDGLKRIGKGMASLRASSADAEAIIEKHFDGVTDADHQAIIASAASAAASTQPSA